MKNKVFKSSEAFKSHYGYYPTDMPDEMQANAVTTSKNLVITYIKADNSAYNLTIPDYKPGITDEAIATGANAILESGIFNPGGFDLIRLDHAKRVDKTVTDVILG